MSGPPIELRLSAPAKLNLFLHITGRRADGYHLLQTVFQILDYGDELELRARDDGELHLTCEGPGNPDELAADDNLVMRAARTLARRAGDRVPGADLRLHKRLPAGGGLGGGSSDAATALLGLNRLWGLELHVDTLADIGAGLGADVPVFVRGYSAWAEGIGEDLTPLELPECWYLVLRPNCSVATGVIFSHPQLTRDTPAITIPAFFAGQTRNDCEDVVRRLAKPVDKALIWLQNFGDARMTGSGSCVFAAFESEATARRIAAQVPAEWEAFVARGVNRSPVLDQLNGTTG